MGGVWPGDHGKGASEEVSGPEEQKIPWEARRGLLGAASGSSLDSGETREGQALLEGCREVVYWKESSSEQVGGGKKLPKMNHGLGDLGTPWQGLVWWGQDVEE